LVINPSWLNWFLKPIAMSIRSLGLISILFFTFRPLNAQWAVGPSARISVIDQSGYQIKPGAGIDVSFKLNDRFRLTLSPYLSFWNDEEYLRSGHFAGAAGDYYVKDTFHTEQYGFSVDLETRMNTRNFFWLTGLGYSHYRNDHVQMTTDGQFGGNISQYLSTTQYQKLLFTGGMGHRWAIGPGQLRTSLVFGLAGFDLGEKSRGSEPHLLSIGAFTLSYQFGPN
jgi:hypothetical protein